MMEPKNGNNTDPVLDAVRRYFDEETMAFHLHRGDHMLAWLWVNGFKVVPLDDKDK